MDKKTDIFFIFLFILCFIIVSYWYNQIPISCVTNNYDHLYLGLASLFFLIGILFFIIDLLFEN